MKLYYSTGACSLSVHISLHESGLAFEALAAPTKTHQLADGTDYYTINPLGYVPLLVLDDGTKLRECPAILQYVADQVPDRQLAPANGTLARTELQSWLNFIATELHVHFGPLFGATTPQEYKTAVSARIADRLSWVDGELSGKQFLMGDQYSIADAYLFTVSNWTRLVGIDLSPYTHLLALRKRVAARPAVIAAMKAEGLIK